MDLLLGACIQTLLGDRNYHHLQHHDWNHLIRPNRGAGEMGAAFQDAPYDH